MEITPSTGRTTRSTRLPLLSSQDLGLRQMLGDFTPHRPLMVRNEGESEGKEIGFILLRCCFRRVTKKKKRGKTHLGGFFASVPALR